MINYLALFSNRLIFKGQPIFKETCSFFMEDLYFICDLYTQMEISVIQKHAFLLFWHLELTRKYNILTKIKYC